MDIEGRIRKFISEELLLGSGQDGISEDESLINSGVLDSLSLLRLIHFMEETFGVTVEDGEVTPDNFDSIASMKTFIVRKGRSK